MFLDALIHERLGVTRLVRFVVAQPAEANDVQYDVLLVLLSIVERDPHSSIGSFGVIAVNMKDR